MATVKNSIIINAPVEKVFEYLTPENLPEIWPSLVEVTNVQKLPNGGYSWDWIYKMAGMRLTGHSEHIEFVLNERTVAKSTGGIESEIAWEYQSIDVGTKMVSSVDYKVPVPSVGKIAESIVAKINENEAEVVLANVKARMET